MANNPPFKKGQRILRTAECSSLSVNMRPGCVYTCTSCFRCATCGNWFVTVGFKHDFVDPSNQCGGCGHQVKPPSNDEYYFNAEFFVLYGELPVTFDFPCGSECADISAIQLIAETVHQGFYSPN